MTPTLIRMPRSEARGGGAARGRARWNLVRLGWYAGCMVFGCGCLYTAPVVKMNQLPTIRQPEGYQNGAIDLTLGQINWLVVVGDDSDSKELDCHWILPSGEYLADPCARQGAEVYMQHEVEYDPEIDGSTFEAHIFDPDADDEVVVKWHVHLAGGVL